MSGRDYSNLTFEKDADDTWHGGQTSTERHEAWGQDETDYWAKVDAEKKAARREKRTFKQRAPRVTVDELPTEHLEWTMPKIRSANLVEQMTERQSVALPTTRTAISPWTDMTKPENKKRTFANLHRQLKEECERADWIEIGNDTKFEVERFCATPVETWDLMDIELMEQRIRDLVRFLIKRRRDQLFKRTYATKSKEEHTMQEEDLLIDLS